MSVHIIIINYTVKLNEFRGYKMSYFYLLELSVIYDDTKFGVPPHEAKLSPAQFVVQSLLNCFIRFDM